MSRARADGPAAASESDSGAEFRRQLVDKSAIAEVTPALTLFLEDQGLEPRARYATELVCEELLSNIAKYGGGASAGPIEVMIKIRPRAVTLTFEDRGPAFDPGAYDKAPTGQTLEEAAVGGLGLHLVKKFASSISYERHGGINRTEVRISRPDEPLTDL